MRSFDQWNDETHTDIEDGRKYCIYCKEDVSLMRYGWVACLQELATLTPNELALLSLSLDKPTGAETIATQGAFYEPED